MNKSDPLSPFQHRHDYLGPDHDRNAGRTRIVMMLTALVMVAEIGAGLAFGSMALFADGLHMAGHVAVLGAAAYAYAFGAGTRARTATASAPERSATSSPSRTPSRSD